MNNVIELIPTGYENRITRKQLSDRSGTSDRDVRITIATARNNGALIISKDGGYFFVDAADGVEVEMVREYLAKERHRVHELQRTIRKMSNALAEEIYKAKL